MHVSRGSLCFNYSSPMLFHVLIAKLFPERNDMGLKWSPHAHMAHRQKAVPHESLFDYMMARSKIISYVYVCSFLSIPSFAAEFRLLTAITPHSAVYQIILRCGNSSGIHFSPEAIHSKSRGSGETT